MGTNHEDLIPKQPVAYVASQCLRLNGVSPSGSLELEWLAASGLINHSEPLSTSEVGLNLLCPSPCQPLIPVHGSNRD